MHVSRKVDVRDILDCDYKVIAQIVNMVLVPKRGSSTCQPSKPLPFDILSMNLYMSSVVSKLQELEGTKSHARASQRNYTQFIPLRKITCVYYNVAQCMRSAHRNCSVTLREMPPK